MDKNREVGQQHPPYQKNKQDLVCEFKSYIIDKLDRSEKNVSNDPPYPNDTQAWVDFRTQLRSDLTAIQSMTLVELQGYSVPLAPF